MTLEKLILWYDLTGNPFWLWLSIACCSSPGDLHPKAFEYLRAAAVKMQDGFKEQVSSLENFRITPPEQAGEADHEQEFDNRSRAPKLHPPPPSIMAILGFRHPGRNHVQAAARDVRDISLHVAVETFVRVNGVSREEAYTLVAKALGRDHPDAGPAVALIRRFAKKGSKLTASASPP